VETTPDPEAAYYQAVEEYFVSRRGESLFLSNADWNLVRKWRLAGIPLRVVLRGIRDALDAHAHGFRRDHKVGSLAYCAREVETARERWASALTLGRGEGADPASAVAGFAAQLEQASGLGPRARAVADTLVHEMRSGPVPAALAELTGWLAEREARLLAAIAAEEPAAQREAREREVELHLEPWRGRMPARVLEQLRSESLARRTLEAHALPRLSLFHLEGGGGVAA
jgi:hypothetical protein